jgi:cytochrome P450
MHDEMMTFIFTGHETQQLRCRGCGTCWRGIPKSKVGFYEGSQSSTRWPAPTLEDLPNLPYARMVFQEAMRLYPPVWTVARCNLEEAGN